MINRPITLFHTDCVALKGGDFALAAGIAHSLTAYLHRNGQYTHQCIMTSGHRGINKLRMLFGTERPDFIDYAGIKLEIANLEHFQRSPRARAVVNYIEVAACKPAHPYLVSSIVRPTNANVIYIGLPHYKIVSFDLSLPHLKSRISPNTHTAAIYIGFGAGRCGIPAPAYSPCEEARLDRFNHITNDYYGFVYFNATDPYAIDYICDYLRIATALPELKKFIIIGNLRIVHDAARKFLAKSPHHHVVIHDEQRGTHIFKCKTPHTVSTEYYPPHQRKHFSKHIIELHCTSTVSHPEMQTLMAGAHTFIGTTGIASMTEAISYGKTPLYQELPRHAEFYEDYKRTMLDQSANVQQLAALLGHDGRFGSTRIDQIITLIFQQATVLTLGRFNSALMRNCTVVDELRKHLNLTPQPIPVQLSPAKAATLFGLRNPTNENSTHNPSTNVQMSDSSTSLNV